MQKQLQKGFTLIELMIVIAIVGLLATLAVPRYNDYTKRAKLGEALQLLDATKLTVTEAQMTNGAMPDTVALPGQTSTYVSGIAYAKKSASEAFVTATLQGDSSFTGKKISLHGVMTGNNLVWTCENGDSAAATPVDAGILPSTCTTKP